MLVESSAQPMKMIRTHGFTTLTAISAAFLFAQTSTVPGWAPCLTRPLMSATRTSNETFRRLTDYTRNPRVIEAARQRLAQAILDKREGQASPPIP